MQITGEIDRTVGEQAFESLRAELEALRADEVKQPTLDLRKVAVIVLRTVAVLEREENLARLSRLPPEAFEPSSLARLRSLGLAAWYTKVEAASARTRQEERARLGQLGREARQLRARMSRVVAHNFAGDAVTAAELAAIGRANGFVQLAGSLTRLAKLYSQHAARLSKDGAWYRADDGLRAATVAHEILGLATHDDPWPRRVSRVWTLLQREYAAVIKAADMVLPRAVAETELPRLHVVGRKKARPLPRDLGG